MAGFFTTKMTTQVGEVIITSIFLENKVLKSIALEDATLKLISSDRQDHEKLLTD